MATRTYPRNGLGFSEPQLNALLDTALGLVGCVSKATETTIAVTHPSLGAGHDAAVLAALAAYVLDPDFGMAPERLALKNAVSTLRQWATDARAVDTGWTGTTYSATKDGQLRVLFRRNAVLLDRLADVLQVQGLN